MNLKKILLLALFLVSINSYALEIQLNSKKIKELLNENTANGLHYQKQTKQYFSKSGLTLWISTSDLKPTEGKWKVENNKYCSDFGSGFNCYQIIKDDKQGIYYFMAKDFKVPFIMQKGYLF